MGFIFFPHKNRINGKYVNVFGERYDLTKIDEKEIANNKLKGRTIYNSEEEFAEFCDLKKFEDVKRGRNELLQ